MRCAIVQPSYIPWRGYFDMIRKADIFVFYDCVQYDDRGWRNRNQIKTQDGLKWLTIPVRSRGAQTHCIQIKDIPIVWDTAWHKKHLNAISHSYAKAPYVDQYVCLLENYYERRYALLADLTCDLTIALARELGVHRTEFVRSSTLTGEGKKTDRLLSILRQLGASHYISGPTARSYMESEKFDAAGITIEYMNYQYPEYLQLHGSFMPNVSIIDLLLMAGRDAGKYIWGADSDL